MEDHGRNMRSSVKMQNRCHEQGTADEHVDPSSLYSLGNVVRPHRLERGRWRTYVRAHQRQLDQPMDVDTLSSCNLSRLKCQMRQPTSQFLQEPDVA